MLKAEERQKVKETGKARIQTLIIIVVNYRIRLLFKWHSMRRQSTYKGV